MSKEERLKALHTMYENYIAFAEQSEDMAKSYGNNSFGWQHESASHKWRNKAADVLKEIEELKK